LRVDECEYVVEAAGFTFAGVGEYSDHAVLCLDILQAGEGGSAADA